MIEIVKVSSRGQIVIPERLREELNIEEGTKLVLMNNNNSIILEKENSFMKKIDLKNLDNFGWLAIAAKSLSKEWDNKKDEETWSKYL